RLAAMTQGVGKEEPETSSTPSAEASLYPVSAAYMQSYGWPQNYGYFGQPLGPAAFPGWPQCYPNPAWPNYGELFASSKKGRQTYQRYQTSVLEAKFQQSSYVSKKQREELRMQTQLTDRQIKIWFQNRRMKAKKVKQRVDDHSEHTPLLPANPPKGMGMDPEDEKKWQMAAHWPPAASHNPYQYPLCP
uniref:Homeobox domain-containing protein n=1 Tax=Caenorhabditis japonica TaxID=281687 RepID=A0A8R1EJ15_CAEJA